MIVAPQFYDGDLDRAAALARLLADVEPEPRRDVLISLVRRRDTAVTPLLEHTMRHCSLKFDVELITSDLPGTGHPEGPSALWHGAARSYYERWRAGKLAGHDAVLMLDGDDAVPLHADWLDRLTAEHLHTLNEGKLITGSPYLVGTCPLHVNPNALYQVEVFGRTNLLCPPAYDGTLQTHYDIYHRDEMLEHCLPSSVVRTDWRGAGKKLTREVMLERSRRSLWLHGYKDAELYWIARDHLADRPAPPEIRYYDLRQLRTQEAMRRGLEEAELCW